MERRFLAGFMFTVVLQIRFLTIQGIVVVTSGNHLDVLFLLFFVLLTLF